MQDNQGLRITSSGKGGLIILLLGLRMIFFDRFLYQTERKTGIKTSITD